MESSTSSYTPACRQLDIRQSGRCAISTCLSTVLCRLSFTSETVMSHLCRLLKTSVNDLLTAMDNNKICILTRLDLSAAFHTIDHQILLRRLQHSFGIFGPALSWFSSYLSNRTHAVTINSLQSEHTPPCLKLRREGSVLGLCYSYSTPSLSLT